MFFDNVKLENSMNNITSGFLSGKQGGVCFLGYEDDTVSGRLNLKIKGKNGIESIANNPKIATTTPTAGSPSDTVSLNYQEADVWVLTGITSGHTVVITVNNLNGSALIGRSLMLNVVIP